MCSRPLAEKILCCSGCDQPIVSKYSGCKKCGYSPSVHATYFQTHCPNCHCELIWRREKGECIKEWPLQCPNCGQLFDRSS